MRYSVSLSELLSSSKVKEGDRIRVTADGHTYTGTLMPHHDFSDGNILVVKLKSGYNVGVKMIDGSKIELIESPVTKSSSRSMSEPKEGLKDVVLIGTGGTIASYVDYRTGAVHPALSTSDLVNVVPEIRDIANIRARVLFSIFSENMSVNHWQELAKAVAEEFNSGAQGIIIPHGTDTMGYTAAVLSFMLPNISRPVLLVGAQRSSDRPSSDACSNLVAAARFCVSSQAAGVFVLMHDTPGDDSFAVHIGSRVRKMHTSRRDAFRSMNVRPAATIDKDGNITFSSDTRPSSDDKVKIATDLEKEVALLQYYPGMDPELFRDVFMRSKGVVISGSGLGHINENMIPLVRKACDNGTVVVMTSQCLSGSTNMNVYNTGRDLISAGVISVGDMLPETAYVKLMWALANTRSQEEAKEIMKIPLAGEMSDRRTINAL